MFPVCVDHPSTHDSGCRAPNTGYVEVYRDGDASAFRGGGSRNLGSTFPTGFITLPVAIPLIGQV